LVWLYQISLGGGLTCRSGLFSAASRGEHAPETVGGVFDLSENAFTVENDYDY